MGILNEHPVYDPLSTKVQYEGHNSKLLKNSPNLNTYKYFFTNRVTNLWNQLPSDVVNASSVNCFKNKIDRLLQTYTFQTKIDIYDMKITAEA